jgi:uncharacterized protein (UPF0147 family)|tara:strand:+ start:8348 stop:9253 length:906 start_codon:yes stop_codon:yes gene_type:complete
MSPIDTDNLLTANTVMEGEPAKDSPAEGDNFDVQEFMDSLDQDVNSGIIDDNQSEGEVRLSPEEPATFDGSQSPGQTQEHDWEKRYGDSTTEARKLNSKLNDVEPYIPILDAMKEDPNLVQHMRNYFEGNGSVNSSSNLKEQLGLDEDFIFDYDEAISDQNSDSAKVMNTHVDGLVQQRLGEYANRQNFENARADEQSKVQQKFNLSDDQMGQMVDFAKNRSLTMDDIYYLYTRENRDQTIADNARKEVAQQMKNVRQKPASVSSAGAQDIDTGSSQDDQVFNALLHLDQGVEALSAKLDK